MTRRILFIEPFESGSHAAFAKNLTEGIDAEWTLATLPGRHWKWRMRGSALWLAEHLPEGAFDVVFATSMFPLAELKGACPQLDGTPTILYFHENQVAYPSRTEFKGERDNHFAFTEISAAHAASAVVFNSDWNRRSFLRGANELIARMPDARPSRVTSVIAAKSRVMPVPCAFLPAEFDRGEAERSRDDGPIILWNHRWEHDKRPDVFLAALRELRQRDVRFRLAICGERTQAEPAELTAARSTFADCLVHCGFCETSERYRELLGRAHIVVSTADHEFFGMAVLEAVDAGAMPLVPDRLAYAETIPEAYRYADDQLVDRLAVLCNEWRAGERALRMARPEITGPFDRERWLKRYDSLLDEYIVRNTS